METQGAEKVHGWRSNPEPDTALVFLVRLIGLVWFRLTHTRSVGTRLIALAAVGGWSVARNRVGVPLLMPQEDPLCGICCRHAHGTSRDALAWRADTSRWSRVQSHCLRSRHSEIESV
jgi:hypothetical protein